MIGNPCSIHEERYGLLFWRYSDDVLDWSEGRKQISDRDVILLHVNQKGAHSISATIDCFSHLIPKSCWAKQNWLNLFFVYVMHLSLCETD